MRILIFAFLGFLSLAVKGQGGIVSAPILEKMKFTEMGLEAEERANEERRHREGILKYSQQVKLATEEVKVAKERLQFVKDGIERLRKINANINNLKALERALDRQKYMIERSVSFMQGVEERDILSLDQTMEAFSTLQGNLSSTSYTISMLTLVLKQGETEMDDYSRLALMKSYIDQLNNDILLFETAIYEIKRVENSTMQINTVKYMHGYFTTYTD